MNSIKIITFHRACNYGAVLQTYALQKALETASAMPESVKVTDYRCKKIEQPYHPLYLEKNIGLPKALVKLVLSFPARARKYYKFSRFRREHLRMEPFPSSENDIYVTGSDQVWNLGLTGQDRCYFLEYTKSPFKYSYAASFGALAAYENNASLVDSLISDFQVISLREKNAIDAFPTQLKDKSRTDVDPTFLLGSAQWKTLVGDRPCKEPYIFIYVAQRPKELTQYARELAKATGYKLFYMDDSLVQDRDIKHIRGQSPEDFLTWIYHAEHVFTTSFHGTVFSLLFHKSFFVELSSGGRYNERVANLLEMLDLQELELKPNAPATPVEIDWQRIDDTLASHVDKSTMYLKSIVARDTL